MARKQKANFLKQHYDKLLVVASLLLLIGSLGALVSGTSAANRERGRFQDDLRRMKTDVRAEKLSGFTFDAATRLLENPYQMATGGTFLVAAERVACVQCRRPIRLDADECPYCRAEQPTGEVSEDWDSDGDGIPDAVETALGLNPRDPSDAEGDMDADGFTNLEEYQAKTDPADAGSHPPKFDFLRVSGIEVRKFPFVLKSHVESNNKVRFQFNRGNQSYMLLKGQTLGKTGYVLSDFSVKEEEVKVKGLSKPRKMKLATVTLVKDKDKLVLKEGDPPINGMFVVSFVCLKDAERTVYTAERGGSFEFEGEEFVLDGIDQKAGTADVTQKSSGRSWTVPKE
ncbi:MAG: hypothetical protein II839_11990 [Kiritimatiellae bacterium]|nr:hypothetical protein [Kiritimatiellia bacterium]